MPTHTHTHKHARTTAVRMQIIALSVLSVLSSFFLGIQTAGEVETVAHIAAGEPTLTGDINADGVTDIQDAIAILTLLTQDAEPTVAQLLADPNQDGLLTIDDALSILQEIASRS